MLTRAALADEPDEPGDALRAETTELPKGEPAKWVAPPGEVRTLVELRERADSRMATERRRDPELDADVSKLERRRTVSIALFGLSVASVGAATALVSYHEEEPDLTSSWTGFVLSTIGVGTTIWSAALLPSRKKVREVAEEPGLEAPTVSARFGHEGAMLTLRFRWSG